MGILDRAKQGDAQAIASLINRSLAAKGVTALVRSRQNRLDIVLQAETVPAKAEFLPLIIKGIQNLGIQAPVHLYARRVGDDIAAWKQVLSTAANKSSSSALAVNVNMSQLTNAKPSLPEYEDVVVRFVDSLGRVKCLTSLKELVQVIGRSSFAYPAIAKDVNLRNLLDNLAEFSTLDRAGRQLLTQASILRPGYSWQKVEIQINNQLTFLPTDQSPAINVNVLEDYATPQAEAFARPAGSLLDEFGAAIEGDILDNGIAPEKTITKDQIGKQALKKAARAGDWLDEFGAAIEEDQNIKPEKIIPKAVKNEPEIVPYSPKSGSFLDEFTAAIDSSKPDQIESKQPKIEQKLSPKIQELIKIPNNPIKQVEEQNSDDLFEFGNDDFNISNQPSNQVAEQIAPPNPDDLFEFGNDDFNISSQPSNQVAEEISSQNSVDLFDSKKFSTENRDLNDNSVQDFSNRLNEDLFESAAKDSNQAVELKSFELPPLPPLPETAVPEFIAPPDLNADLFVSESDLPSQTDSVIEPIFEQFSQPKPATAEIPYNMEDLLAELQSSSFIQPKMPKNSSNSESKSSKNKAR